MGTKSSQESSMNEIFNLLRSLDLVNKGRISVPNIKKLPRRDIIDISEAILISTDNPNIGTQKSILSHSASLELGGGRAEGCCMSLGCRLDRLDELARFALMYSDKVYINNYFCDYKHYRDSDLHRLRRMFFDDLCILQAIKPLIDKGYISILTAPGKICPNCLSLHNFDKGVEKRLKAEEIRLRKKIIDACSGKIIKEGKHYDWSCPQLTGHYSNLSWFLLYSLGDFIFNPLWG